MKYFYLLILSLPTLVFSQDLITKTNGETIEAKIIEIGISEIKYNRHDYLDGPLYIIAKNEVAQIDFENGFTEHITITPNSKEFSLDDTKALIVEYINEYAMERTRKYKLEASFDGKYLKLTQIKDYINRLTRNFIYYDFSGECTFHTLSERNNGITFINVYVPRIHDLKIEETETIGETGEEYKTRDEKLVMMIKGHDKAEKLLEALKLYNEYFKTQ